MALSVHCTVVQLKAMGKAHDKSYTFDIKASCCMTFMCQEFSVEDDEGNVDKLRLSEMDADQKKQLSKGAFPKQFLTQHDSL